MIKIGNTEILKIYLGSTEVPKAYLGTVEVYGTGPQPIDYSKEYFTLKALENGHFGWNVERMLYSLNGGAWTAWPNSTGLDVSANDEVRFKDNAGRNGYTNRTISATGKFEVYGNSMSLFSVYGDNFSGATSFPSRNGSEFQNLFSGNTYLESAENLVLPATALNEDSYFQLFYNCSGMTTAPAIIPATTMGIRSCQSMFRGCKKLTKPPVIAATTLNQYCLQECFRDCSSLVSAPDLLATYYQASAYDGLFRNCYVLKYIKCLLETNFTGSISNFTNSVGSGGTFVKSANTTIWTTGSSGIPSNWTIVDN